MKSMLQGLFDGELYPFSQYAPQSKKYKKMLAKHEEHYQDLRDNLTYMQPELVDKFESLIKEWSDNTYMEDSEMFIFGFSLGVRMIIEVYQNELCEKF